MGRWGLLDMSGNVYEWTEDAEIMGGSALSSSEHELQSLAGDRVTPSTRRFDLGFRCAADPQPAEDKRRRRR